MDNALREQLALESFVKAKADALEEFNSLASVQDINDDFIYNVLLSTISLCIAKGDNPVDACKRIHGLAVEVVQDIYK